MKNNSGVLWKRTNEIFGKPKENWKTIDHMIYGVDNYFNEQKNNYGTREKAIIEAFNFHYKNNLFYNQFCKHRKISNNDIKSEKDFTKIPLLPDTFFKDYPSEKPEDIYKWLYQVSSVEIGEYDFKGKKLQQLLEWAEGRLKGIVLHSSGTSGKFSIMFRDEDTMKRLFHMILKLIIFHITDINDNLHLVYPGPTKTFLAMGHALGTASKIFDDEHKHFLTSRSLNMEIVKLMSTGKAENFKQKLEMKLIQKAMKKGQYNIIDLLQNIMKKNEQIVLVSFPFQVWDLMNIMENEGISLNLGDTNSFLLTAGGWKIYSSRKVTEDEFANRVEKVLGISKENYRDAYGMSEMNGLALSCEKRYKHLVDWIYPMILNEEMEPLGYNEFGRFAFLDPAGFGYPGFIISGDRVKLHEKCPKCDKSGIVFESDISRMKGAEGRGCGNLMRELITEEISK